MNQKFWQDKRVFVTGHTGFKGAWLCLWLSSVGAKITGYSLNPPTTPSLFELTRVGELVDSVIADVRDGQKLLDAMKQANPDIVIHMAAQPIVRESYKVPIDTFAINIMGTVNLLEAVRNCPSVKSTVIITTDKVYAPSTPSTKLGTSSLGIKGYKEDDRLGGYDPYSSSKAGAELVAASYRQSYAMNVATARAGNVIGGGDWAVDRLVPDFIRAILDEKKIKIRNPKAVRPWQHVLEPLSGYLLLAEKLFKAGNKYAGSWNFGPAQRDDCSVALLVKELCQQWGAGADYDFDKGRHPHEAAYLRLDSTKAKKQLGWQPRWHLKTTVAKIVEWTKNYQAKKDLRQICLEQIKEYENAR